MTHTDLSRRAVLGALGGGAVVTVAACGGEEETAPSAGPTSGTELASVADVPVGSGVIVKDLKVVVTQPTEGTFLAFSAVCTHQGCAVGTITGNEILCPCHETVFSTEDGSVVSGPAERPLDSVDVEVKGRRILKA